MEARNLKQLKEQITKGLIQMNSGYLIRLTEIKTDDILIEDIAHHLSMKVRWNGAVNNFYSIAEHCIHVASMVPKELKLEALLHDAPEAYLFDIPRPIKNLFPSLVVLEDSLHQICAEKFGLHFPYHKMVRDADDYILVCERDFLLTGKNFNPFTPKGAKEKFMEMFHLYRQWHKPIDWVQAHVDELKIKLAEADKMKRLADEIEPELRRGASDGKSE